MTTYQDRLAHIRLDAFTLEVRPIPTPLVGADFSVTVPAGEIWCPLSLSGILTTSAAVATRDVRLTVDDQSSVSMAYPSGATQAAGLAVRYCWIAGYPILMAAAESLLTTIPIVEMTLQGGWRMRSTTALIDAGDQWSGLTVTAAVLRRPKHTINAETGVTVDEILQEMVNEAQGRQ